MQIPPSSAINPSACKEFKDLNDGKKEIILPDAELGLLCQERRSTDHFQSRSISASDQCDFISDIWPLSPKLTACSGKRVTFTALLWHQSSMVVSRHALSFAFHCPGKCHLKTSALDCFFPLCLFEEWTSSSFSAPLSSQDC